MDMINRFLTTSARYLELELTDKVRSAGVEGSVSDRPVDNTVDSIKVPENTLAQGD
jgi:hypothetical protein